MRPALVKKITHLTGVAENDYQSQIKKNKVY